MFNLFDECAARFAHMSPQEEECASSSFFVEYANCDNQKFSMPKYKL